MSRVVLPMATSFVRSSAIPVAGEILYDEDAKRLYYGDGVTQGGVALANGGGGTINADFYKCASVDSTNHTWTGYLVIVNPVTGVWSFAETATPGLPYDRITPVVGHVYDADCTFEVIKYKTGIPENGLLFYLPLESEIGDTDAKSGMTITKSDVNGCSFTTVDGIPCCQTGQYGFFVLGPALSSYFANDSTARFTFSFECYPSATFYAGFCQQSSPNTVFGTCIMSGTRYMLHYETGNSGEASISTSTLAHFAVVYDGTYYRLFFNGTEVKNVQKSTPFSSYYPDATQPFIRATGTVYVTAFRLYNRVLDSTEIAALAAEFTPTPAS